MWREVRAEMRTEMRAQELKARRAAQPGHGRPAGVAEAGRRLLAVYAALSRRQEHLFGRLLEGRLPRLWAHYPDDDAIDPVSGYQWFYHSHSPQDRPGAPEHGHIHLFARRPLWSRRLRSASERAFAALCGDPTAPVQTRHLLTIGFDGKGIPISLFTVNSWVTGDRMLGADLTLELLAGLRLNTGHAEVDTVIASVAQLCRPELQELMRQRDESLRAHPGPERLQDPSLELLSECRIDWDATLGRVSSAPGCVTSPGSPAQTAIAL